LSESWISENSHIPFVSGYNHSYITSSIGKSGGIVIYHKCNLKVENLDIQKLVTNVHTEILSVFIKDIEIVISGIYRHPKGKVSDFLTDLDKIFSSKVFLSEKYRKIFCGDFNINTLNNNKNSHDYLSLVQSFDYTISADKPTRITNESSTCIDHIVYKMKPNDTINCIINTFNISDHSSININMKLWNPHTVKTKILRRIHSENNIQTFKNLISNTNWNTVLDNAKNLNDNTFNFVNKLLFLYNISFPITEVTHKENNCEWMNNNIRNMIIHKNYLLKKSKKTKKSQDIKTFSNYNSTLRRAISKQKHAYFLNSVTNLNSKKKWGFINKIKNNKKLKTDVKITSTQYQNYLNQIIPNNSTCNIMPSTNISNTTASLFPASEDEVLLSLLCLKNKYTHQCGDIPMFLYRKIAHEICNPVTCLINTMISTASFPALFKFAVITPIFKKGDKELCKNYRPIAILHNLSKVFERVIYNRMLSFCNKYNILPQYQFGFRPNFSTKDAIVTLILQIEKNYSLGLKTCGIFLDLSKAFDMVNHVKLLNILHNHGFRGHFFSLLDSYLQNRTYSVKINDSFSAPSKITNGVPQGSIISPLLYCLYVTEFSCVHENVIQYADDSTLIISYDSLEHLQLSIGTIEKRLIKFINDRSLVLNALKTEIILFGEKMDQKLNFMANTISTVKTTKFLGIYLSSDMKFDTHIDKSLIPSIRRHFSFFSNTKHLFNKDTKMIIFNAFINSIIIYAVPFLLHSSKGKFHQLEQTYNRAIRLFYNLPFIFPSRHLPQHTKLPSLLSLINHHSLVYTHLIFHRKTPLQVHSQFIRSSHRNNFILSFSCKQSLQNKLANSWNLLPSELKSSLSTYYFKNNIHACNKNT